MGVTFTTTIFQAEGKNATGIRIPAATIEAQGGGKRPRVTVRLNWYTYRSTVEVYGDAFLLPVSQEHREASGLQAGDTVNVTLDMDTAPRTVELPEALQVALSAKAGALAAYEALSDSRRKEVVRQVNDAKTEETRDRRIAKIVAGLGDA